MLVLSRRQGEEIVIGDNIRISVLGNQGGRVRLGITAPSSVPIFRMEIAGTDTSRRYVVLPAQGDDFSFPIPAGDADVQQNTPPVRPR